MARRSLTCAGYPLSLPAPSLSPCRPTKSSMRRATWRAYPLKSPVRTAWAVKARWPWLWRSAGRPAHIVVAAPGCLRALPSRRSRRAPSMARADTISRARPMPERVIREFETVAATRTARRQSFTALAGRLLWALAIAAGLMGLSALGEVWVARCAPGPAHKTAGGRYSRWRIERSARSASASGRIDAAGLRRQQAVRPGSGHCPGPGLACRAAGPAGLYLAARKRWAQCCGGPPSASWPWVGGSAMRLRRAQNVRRTGIVVGIGSPDRCHLFLPFSGSCPRAPGRRGSAVAIWVACCGDVDDL